MNKNNNTKTLEEATAEEKDKWDPGKKKRRFRNNGPTVAMQKKYYEGDISDEEYEKHCREQLKSSFKRGARRGAKR
tara:strand:- start:345 stop:572 length:228 start_codon:yes stop_codon:yes gene_type:complete